MNRYFPLIIGAYESLEYEYFVIRFVLNLSLYVQAAKFYLIIINNSKFPVADFSSCDFLATYNFNTRCNYKRK